MLQGRDSSCPHCQTDISWHYKLQHRWLECPSCGQVLSFSSPSLVVMTIAIGVAATAVADTWLNTKTEQILFRLCACLIALCAYYYFLPIRKRWLTAKTIQQPKPLPWYSSPFVWILPAAVLAIIYGLAR